MAIAQVARIYGPHFMSNSFAFQCMVLRIAESVYYELKEGN